MDIETVKVVIEIIAAVCRCLWPVFLALGVLSVFVPLVSDLFLREADPAPAPALPSRPNKQRRRRPKRVPQRKQPPRGTCGVIRLEERLSRVPKRIHLDQNCSNALAARLRRQGFIVSTTAEAGLMHASDRQQLAYCRRERAVIVTHDHDFLDLDAEGVLHAGIIHVPGGNAWNQEVVRVCLGMS